MEERIRTSQKYCKTKPLKMGNRQLVLIGFGSVGRPFLNRLLAWSTVNPENIIVYDKQDLSGIIPEGVKFKCREIVRGNYRGSLKHLKKGDIIVDLSLYVDTIKLMKYCIEHGLHLITTSIEVWDLHKERKDRTLVASFKSIEKFQKKYVHDGCPTIILNHGANPGIISHFVRTALNAMLPDGPKAHCEKAKKLKVRTIHVSEIDSQKEHEPDRSKWRNTWSINGFYQEGTAPPELGYGSHERSLSGQEIVRMKYGRALILPKVGWNTFVKSYVPDQVYTGYLIQHAEALSINKYLKTGKYSPSVYYVYKPCQAAIDSIERFGMKVDPDPKDQKMLYHSNSSGEDRLGALLMTPKMSWWCGSVCSSTESMKIFDGYEYAGPTSSQVVAGVLGALMVILKKANLGILQSDDIPPKYTPDILEFVSPLLGNIINERVRWNPEFVDLRGLLVKKGNKVNKNN